MAASPEKAGRRGSSGAGPSTTLHGLVAARSACDPAAVAVVSGEQQLTYGQLHEHAERVAQQLCAAGIGVDDVVGVLCERTVHLPVALLGVLRAGAAFLPLPADLPTQRVCQLLSDCGAQQVVSSPALHDVAAATGRSVISLPTGTAAPTHAELVPAAVPDSAAAYVIYTSGSTGDPKGVIVSHAATTQHLGAIIDALGLTATDVVLQMAGHGFDVAIEQMFAGLAAGCQVVLRGDQPWGPAEVCSALVQQRITVADLPTALFAELTTQRYADMLRGAVGTLRTVLVGGEALPATALQRWWRVLGASAPSVHNAYGPTEAVITASLHRADGPAHRGEEVPIGAAVGPRRLYVLNDDQQPASGTGELYIGGQALARGYLGRAADTAARFLPDPWGAPGGRMYRTGDRVNACAADLIFAGRIDDQVKVRGHRIEPAEVERRLLQHTGIAQAAVVAGGDRLVAYLVGADSRPPTGTELSSWLSAQLPGWMLPSIWRYLPELPYTPAGKVDRQRLMSLSDSAETPGAQRLDRVTQDTPLHQICEIWARVLGLAQVEPDGRFFDLGGTSLLAARVQADLRSDLGVELPLQALVANPTPAALAAQLAAGAAITPAGGPDPGGLPTLAPLSGARDQAPVSAMQEQIWYQEQLAPGNTAYNAPTTVRLSGPVDPQLLQRALNDVVRRHEILRTTFGVRDGEPVQLIHPPYPVALVQHDLRGEADPYARAEQLVAEEIRTPFDIARLPLVRWTLLRLADQEYELVLVEHHIIHDGWSFALLMEELLAGYEAAAGWRSPSPPPPLQYADFAHWQRRVADSPAMARRQQYWVQQLAGAPEQLALPYDYARRETTPAPGAMHRVELPAPLCEAVREFSRRNNVTLFNTMLAAYAALLSRFTGQDEVCIGSAYGNRAVPGTEQVLGMFVNPVVLRCPVPASQSFTDLVAALGDVIGAAQAHQELPFLHLVRQLAPPRRPGHNPLFAAMLNVDDAPLIELHAGPISATYLERHNGTAKLDLSVLVVPRAERQIGVPSAQRDQRITMIWEYRSDLFAATSITRLADSYRALLTAALTDPNTSLGALPLHGADPTVPELFARHVTTAPDAPAVRYPGQPWLSYGQLHRRAHRLAATLQRRGIGAEDVVGICLPRSEEFVVAVLGVWLAGAVVLPLDPDSPPDRLGGLLADAAAKALVSDRTDIPSPVARLSPADGVDGDDHGPATASETVVDPDQLAYLIYTSGSTGKPKAVAISHRALVRKYRSWEVAYGLDEHPGTHLQAASVAFDVCVGDLVRALLSGGRLVLCPPEAAADPAALLALIRAEGVDTVELLPSVLNLLAAHLAERDQQLTSLRLVAVGGEPWTGGDLRRYQAALGTDARVLNVYGVTEATIGNTVFEPALTGAVWEERTLPIGRALPDVTAEVCDSQGRPLPPGAVGEIYLGGVGLARGYHGQPGLTAQRFLPDPVVPGARRYRTGDRARYRPDGTIEFLGRVDAQVKVRGFRVEPGEVEHALLAEPGVREAAVVVRHDEIGTRLVAYVSGSVTGEELREAIRHRLPNYLVPASVQTVAALPRTSTGKIDRHALPAPAFLSGQAETSRPPRAGLERQVAQVWQDVLQLPVVGADDDFFDVGGHSLLAARLTMRLATTFGVSLTVRDLLSAPTVARLAERVADVQRRRVDGRAAAVGTPSIRRLVPRARQEHVIDSAAFDESADPS